MIDNLYEQVIIDKRKSCVIKYYACSTTAIILIMFATVMTAYFFSGGLAWIFLIPLILSLGGAFVLLIAKDYAYSEYEYDFIAGTIEVARIINNKRRKTLVKFECSDIEVLSQNKPEKSERYASMPNIRVLKAVFDIKTDDVFFAYFTSNGRKYLLYFAPDKELMTAIKKHIKVRVEQ